MPRHILAEDYQLAKVFKGDFAYRIPSYQRPYSWEKGHAEELFSDIHGFSEEGSADGYFLGSIVLIKEDKKPAAEVIDGQQRLTTLSILICCLAELARDFGQDVGNFRGYLYEAGNELEGLAPQARLTLRDRDQTFFAQYIQGLKIDELRSLDLAQLDNDAQRNIARNALHLRNLTKDTIRDTAHLKRFASFLLTECFLVVISTPTQESAFRVFSTMNSRGLDLRPTDILKSEILGQIQEGERDAYAKKWEDREADLGREEFNNLFGHIRTLYRPEKQRATLLEEFRKYVLTAEMDAKDFVDKILVPHVDAYQVILEGSYKASTADAERVNRALAWLGRIDHIDWIPAALAIMTRWRNKPAVAAEFFEQLERLAAWLLIVHIGVSQRITRYARVIDGVTAGKKPSEISRLAISGKDIELLVEFLEDDIYTFSRRRLNYIILRLDSFMSDNAVSYDHKKLTIEHVLPQTVSPRSQWAQWWPKEEDREVWVHRLANLVALNRNRNSSAGNRDFAEKVDTYFKGNKNVPSYTLTTKMLGVRCWKMADLEKRQAELINVMLAGWELKRRA